MTPSMTAIDSGDRIGSVPIPYRSHVGLVEASDSAVSVVLSVSTGFTQRQRGTRLSTVPSRLTFSSGRAAKDRVNSCSARGRSCRNSCSAAAASCLLISA